MKQRLLSMLAVVGLSVTAMAQTWTAPIEPAVPDIQGVELEDGASYYIRNVGAGQYIVGANSWATQISLSNNATPNLKVKLTKVANSWIDPELEPDLPAEGWEMSLDGPHYFTGDHDRKDYEVAGGKKLFRDSEESGFVDLGSQNRGFIWNLTKNENGTYYIQTIPGDTNYPDAEFQFAGVEANPETAPGAPVKFNLEQDTEAYWIEWEFIPITLFSDYDAAVLVYKARKVLYQYLIDAEKYGANTAEAGAVYNNADATAEEINAAAAALRPEVRKAILAYAEKNATADATVDLTYYVLENPAFESGDLTGWSITEGGGNRQYQGSKYDNEEAGVTIQGFIETWVAAPSHLADGSASQKVGGLPDGHYILECDGMAVNQTGYDNEAFVEKDDYTGAYLFYSNGAITVKSQPLASDRETRTNEETGEDYEVWLPVHFTFEFDVTNADTIQVGFMTDGANINWLAADNFKLIAAGPVQAPPAYTALLTEIGVADGVLDQRSEVEAQAAAYDALDATLAEVKPLAEAAASFDKVAEYEAAYTKLNAARTEVQASIAAYARVQPFIEKLAAEMEQYDNDSYRALYDKIDAIYQELEDGKDQATISAARINEIIDGYDEMVKGTVQAIFEEAAQKGEPLDTPLDITALFNDMSFAYGTSQVAFANGYPTENPVWMNETKTGNFKTNYSTAEVWDARPFNIYREFQGLPKGKYTIQTHAFFRNAANDTNYPDWQNDPELNAQCQYAYLYAGSTKSPIVNVGEIACPEFANLNDPWDATDGNYIPNNQQSAYRIFTEEQFAAQAEKTLVEASSVVTVDGGTLRVGVVGTDALQGNQWTIWYGFRLLYHGISASDIDAEIENLMGQLSDLADNAYGVKEGIETKQAALAAGDNALGSEDSEVKNAAVAKLNDAIAYLNESQTLVAQIMDAIGSYDEKLDETLYTDTNFPALVAAINEANANNENPEGSYESNQQIKNWLAQLPNEFCLYVLSKQGIDDATIDNPVDMSEMIVNNDFADCENDFAGVPQGWTVVTEDQGGGKGREKIMEFWNCGAFDIYQEMPMLKDGYWRLECDALFRAGGGDNEVGALTDSIPVNHEYFYASTSTWNVEQNVCQWSDFKNGAVLNNEENEELISLLSGQTEYSFTRDDVETKFLAPNNQTSMLSFIAAERYHNTLTFQYLAGQGSIRLGLKLIEKVSNCWCPFTNFRLSYLGTTAPDAVKSIADSKNAAPAAIFTIDGRAAAKLQRGINIVRRADGSVQKVLVK